MGSAPESSRGRSRRFAGIYILVVYNRGDNAFVGSFKIGNGPTGVDGVSGQDGADVPNFNLGPAFPNGLFTSQDHVNSNAGNGNSGNQNYKYAS